MPSAPTMLVHRRGYPQVDPRAAGLMTRAVVAVPTTLSVEAAARVSRRRGAALLLARSRGRWEGVTPATLERALGLGLNRVRLDACLWEAPAVAPAAAEVGVRRLLGPGTPFVVVVDRGRPRGAVLADGAGAAGLPLSVADALTRLDDGRVRILRRAGALGSERGWAVVAVGGLVRDLILRGALPGPVDVDLAVEGDGPLFAARLADAFRADLARHDAFQTATLVLRDGQRVDVATARRERYVRPGALPAVEPGTLTDDLGRRDFSVNALAVRLDGPAWGEVVDPTGGLVDLRRRRLRVLHPLSFIEDPTRILRAVRFAVRLGLELEQSTHRLLTAATALAVYDALSGDRLRAELETILREPAPVEVLERLARAGAFRLLLPTYRFPPTAAGLLRAVPERARSLPLAGETVIALYVLALTAHLEPVAAEAWTRRLSVPAPTRATLARARAEAPELLSALARARGPDEAYRALRPIPEAVVAWAYIRARGGRARQWLGEHLRRWRHLRPLLTGDDLASLGFEPGPRIGRLLIELLSAQVAGRLADRSEALAWLKATVPRPRGGRGEPRAREPASNTHPDERGG